VFAQVGFKGETKRILRAESRILRELDLDAKKMAVRGG